MVNLQTRHKVVTFQSSSRMERVLPMKVATSGGTLSYRLCYPVKAKSRVLLLLLLAFLSRHKFINLTDLIQTQREEKTRVRHARVISPSTSYHHPHPNVMLLAKKHFRFSLYL